MKLTEEKIPNDIEMINASFNKDASCEKYTTTKEFAKSINENKIGICDNIDEYIEIVKTIKGVIDVRKIDDDTCEFAIS